MTENGCVKRKKTCQVPKKNEKEIFSVFATTSWNFPSWRIKSLDINWVLNDFIMIPSLYTIYYGINWIMQVCGGLRKSEHSNYFGTIKGVFSLAFFRFHPIEKIQAAESPKKFQFSVIFRKWFHQMGWFLKYIFLTTYHIFFETKSDKNSSVSQLWLPHSVKTPEIPRTQLFTLIPIWFSEK